MIESNKSEINTTGSATKKSPFSFFCGLFQPKVQSVHVTSKVYTYAMRRFWALLIPLTIIGATAFYFAFSLLERIELAELDSQTKSSIKLASNQASHDFENVYSDLKYLVGSELINQYLLDRDLSGHQDKVEKSFINLIKTHKIYDQIRLLSKTGQELVRINNNQGYPTVVPIEQLQDKSNRYYFTEAAKLNDNRVYVSHMDLNIENSVVELPYKPMVRFAQPIRDSNGNLTGVVVINYLGNVLLDRFRQQMKHLAGESMLLNSDGYWLSGSTREQEWGFMFNKPNTFAQQHPKVWEQVQGRQTGIVETEQGRFSFAVLHPLPPVLLVNSPQSDTLDNWKIIVINERQGVNIQYLLERLGYIYPLLVAYPIGLIILWFWAKASSGRKVAEYKLHELNRSLEEQVTRRTEELEATQDVTILCMASLAETRDNETGQHIRRTQHYIKLLANALKDHPDFHVQLDGKAIDLIFKSAPLHDIGKVGIPDAILLKTGRLTEQEFEVMKKHTTYGTDAIEEAINSLSGTLGVAGSRTFLHYARNITHYHHERWDGSGYPKGLVGDAIPLSARLMALADVYDALVSQRVYKKAFSRELAEKIILEQSQGQFDPRILRAFDQIKDQFWDIRKHYGESGEDDAVDAKSDDVANKDRQPA